jgi:hypothetical protein
VTSLDSATRSPEQPQLDWATQTEAILGVPLSEWQALLTQRAKEEAAAGNTVNLEAFKRQCATLIGFTEYRFPRYRTAAHHRLIGEQLERVERGEIDRLMLLMPPRHGKSELASKSMPAWSIGRKPWRQFISASASVELARDWGREVRNIVMSESADEDRAGNGGQGLTSLTAMLALTPWPSAS